jgi:lipooligosaccharide transport system permease protein
MTLASTAPQSFVDGVLRQWDGLLLAYQRTWKASLYSSFLTPVLYVVAMGVIVGGFIVGDPARLEGAHSYLAFVVPGLIAAHAMQTAAAETTYPVMAQIKWDKTYFAAVSTPLQPKHLVGGYLLYCLFRLATVCGIYTLVMVPFGVFATWWSPIASWLAACLTGLAFATVIYGFTTRVKSEQSFGVLFRFGVMPMFLFSGAFFPVANLGFFEVFKWLVPLWHGVNLTRMASLATWDWASGIINMLVLGGACLWGLHWAARGLEKRLIA